MLARESTATMTPSLKMKASVVVPCAGFTISMTSRSKESTCTRDTDVEHVEVAAFTCEHVSARGGRALHSRRRLLGAGTALPVVPGASLVPRAAWLGHACSARTPGTTGPASPCWLSYLSYAEVYQRLCVLVLTATVEVSVGSRTMPNKRVASSALATACNAELNSFYA